MDREHIWRVHFLPCCSYLCTSWWMAWEPLSPCRPAWLSLPAQLCNLPVLPRSLEGLKHQRKCVSLEEGALPMAWLLLSDVRIIFADLWSSEWKTEQEILAAQDFTGDMLSVLACLRLNSGCHMSVVGYKVRPYERKKSVADLKLF